MNQTKRTFLLAVVVSTFLPGAECDDVPPVTVLGCKTDDDCDDGEICEDNMCVEKDSLSCATVDGGAAILQPGPSSVDFGRTTRATNFRELTLRNIGDCTLNIFDATVIGDDAARFDCPDCDFPGLIELFPFRETRLTVAFTPAEGEVGDFRAEIELLSDDAEYGRIRVPIRATYDGVPVGLASPKAINFGYVDVGRHSRRIVHLSNRGVGEAKLIVSDIRVEPSTVGFSFTTDVELPVELAPSNIDTSAFIPIEVTYRPDDVGQHVARLVMVTNQDPADGPVDVDLRGTSESPPSATIAPERVQFGSVPIGTTNVDQITIQNEGGAPLEVTYEWAPGSFDSDLATAPSLIPVIEPGSHSVVQVFATPTRFGEINGILLFHTNDPSNPTIPVAISARGTDTGADNQVVKVEMTYQNRGEGFFSNDLRNADLTLESPWGHVCNKDMPNPTNWGNFGDPFWIGFGVNQQPERIVLPNAQSDGLYRVSVQYAEDCANVPTALVAGLLGISVEALIAYIGGGALPPGLVGPRLEELIDDLCINRSGTTANVVVTVNGRVIAERAVALSRKGDSEVAMEIEMRDGEFQAP